MRFIRDTIRLSALADGSASWGGHLRRGRWSIEHGARPPAAHRPELLLDGAIVGAGFAVSLRSETVLRLEAAHGLVDRLAAEGCVIDRRAVLALHELILNAAIHGNLAVGSGPSGCWADLADRARLMTDALANPSLSARIVTVALCWTDAQICMAIADEGGGYVQPDIAPLPRPGARRAAGNGLRIARAAGEVTVADAGRRTTLVVRRLAAAQAG